MRASPAKRASDEIVEKSLRGAALWDEVKDRLSGSALGLSGGQQQRLCIARAIAVEPEVILMDEPCSALDPIATASIEELMQDLKSPFTHVIVTHNMQQASRVSDYTAFLYLGKLIEYAPTEKIFIKPAKKQTKLFRRLRGGSGDGRRSLCPRGPHPALSQRERVKANTFHLNLSPWRRSLRRGGACPLPRPERAQFE